VNYRLIFFSTPIHFIRLGKTSAGTADAGGSSGTIAGDERKYHEGKPNFPIGRENIPPPRRIPSPGQWKRFHFRERFSSVGDESPHRDVGPILRSRMRESRI
jgi:hypothetical protein